MGDLARLIGAVWKLTGGRPMRRIGYAFTDVVSGAAVYYWRDRLGRVWVAEGALSLFRVPSAIAAVKGTTKIPADAENGRATVSRITKGDVSQSSAD